MKKLIILFGLLAFIIQSNAQNPEPIQIINGKFYQNDVRLKLGTVKETVRPVPLAYQEAQIGVRRIRWGKGLVISGTIFATVSIYELLGLSDISSEDTSTGDVLTGLVVGIGLDLSGWLLLRNGSKRLLNGVDKYNSSIRSQTDPRSTSVNIGLTNHGIGLIVRF